MFKNINHTSWQRKELRRIFQDMLCDGSPGNISNPSTKLNGTPRSSRCNGALKMAPS
jgi:hypothetical protein